MPTIFSRAKTVFLSGLLLYSIFYSALGQSTPPMAFTDGRYYPGCDGATCILPACKCPSTETPGNLPREETPQFVTVTFDDAVTGWTLPYTAEILNGYKNPNDCSAKATYYVTGTYTNYWALQQLYAQGNEIAIHTFTHSTRINTTEEVFEAEILGLRRTIALMSRIPEDSIRGFRAPYLELNTNALNVLYNNNFTYDSSITETPMSGYSTSTSNMIWPYTMDNGVAQPTWVSNVTDAIFPGFWSVPMYTINDPASGGELSQDPRSASGDVEMLLKTNFEKHITGNKSPFGLYINPSYLQDETVKAEVLRFFDYANSFKDVYFVTSSQILDWVKNPIPLSEMATSPMFACAPRYSSPTEVCNGLDDDGDGEIDTGLTKTCVYEEGFQWFNFETCAPTCPTEYPTVGTVDFQTPSPKVCDGMVVEETTECAETESSSSVSSSSSSSGGSVSSDQSVVSSSSSEASSSSSDKTSLSSSDAGSSHSSTPSEDIQIQSDSAGRIGFCLGLILVVMALMM